jgi:DNA-binding transcriptional MerR regulator
MFTQLDLFGDLPAPEKPSNPSQRTEKKSTAKSGNAGSSVQATQAQLSMGLPDEVFPEPSQDWSRQEVAAENELPEELQPASTEQSETIVDGLEQDLVAETAPQPVAGTEGQPQAEAPPFEADQTAVKTDSRLNKPGPTTIYGDIPTESKAEKGRRYYIQTEIPADPPLTSKPPGPEALMAGLVTSRNTAQESRPKYIQTEIPSDPIEPPSLSVDPPLRNEPVSERSVTPQETPSPTSIAGAQAPSAATEEKQEAKRPEIPAEALRRTRPLMPPKVILADPALETSTDVTGEKDNVTEKDPPVLKEPAVVIPAATAEKPEEKEESIVSEIISADQPPADLPFSDPLTAVATEVEAVQASTRRKRVVKESLNDSPTSGVPPDDQLNAKQYYSIGEVAAMFSVKASLLRYWESEFDVLKLRKNRKGDRFFRPDDIRSLQLIHHLLKEKKYTIEGAREYMRNAGKMKEKFETIETLQRIRQFLVEMRNGLQIERLQDTQ